jgi:hypothetical protein
MEAPLPWSSYLFFLLNLLQMVVDTKALAVPILVKSIKTGY